MYSRFLLLFFLLAAVQPLTFGRQSKAADRLIVSGLVLLNDKTPLHTKPLFDALGAEWQIKADSISEKEETVVFLVGDVLVMLARQDYALPPNDIAAAAQISWLWKNAETEAARHQSHLIVSVIGKPSDALSLHKLFTKIAACMLENTNSVGIYLPNQYLLLSKGYYLESAKNMSSAVLPLYLWVYFGLLQDNGRSSGYTYGLKEFGLEEMEVVNSTHNLQEVHAFLYDAAQEIVLSGKHLKEGDQVGTKEDGKVSVTISKCTFLDDMSVKLDF